MKHLEALGKFRASSHWTGLAAAALFALTLAGCGGSDGKDGAPGKDADPAVLEDLQAQIDAITKAVNPETCVVCHQGGGSASLVRSGPNHQELYNELYQDGKIVISNMSFTASGTTATLNFRMTKFGGDFDCTKATSGAGAEFSIGSYWAEYDPATKTFPSDQSLVGTKAYLGGGNCRITRTSLPAATITKMNGPGIVQIYGTDEIVERDAARHMSIGKYPFAGVLKLPIAGSVDYTSAANVTGCENCHTRPFLKHAYIYGTVKDQNGQPTEFYTCKGCHYDTRNGGHEDWQLLKDDPAKFAEYSLLADAAEAAGDTTKNSVKKNMTPAEVAKYAYKAKLMNDVHMSHAMEFPYPQGMNNCITCHASKSDPTKVNAAVVADDKFKVETCKSCHAVENLISKLPTTGTDHSSLFPALRDPTAPQPQCGNCHVAGAPQFQGPTFAMIHNGGYNPLIYSSSGARYSETFKVNITSASVDASNKLTIKFNATGSLTSPALSATNIMPTVMVGLYGYNSKDFLVAAHGYDSADRATRKRLLEFKIDGVDCQANPRCEVVSAANGSWEIKVDLTMWASQIAWTAGQTADRAIRRAEISVMPELKNGSLTLGLNAPSKTFNFAKNDFENYYTDIVDVAKGCNTCHDQLATTFHSGIRGGNIKVCRTCHVVSSGGSHLELQSRSIDSYVHAVHSFQAFDPGDIDFGNPEESVEYSHHVNSAFPRFGILDCESCHVPASKGGSTPGTPHVPDQAKSMPGILSGTDTVAGRNIGDIPSYVTGPGVRACGACHRAQKINADDAGGLTVLNQHFKTFGYLIENADGLWESVVAKIMAMFKF